MKNAKKLKQAIPTYDYRPALQGALSWLGDRYLLAEPLNRRSDDQKSQFSTMQSGLNVATQARV